MNTESTKHWATTGVDAGQPLASALAELLHARDLDAFASRIVESASALGYRDAGFAWQLGDSTGWFGTSNGSDPALARGARENGRFGATVDGRRAALHFGLDDGNDGATILLTKQHAEQPWSDLHAMAAPVVRNALERARLERSMRDLERSGQLQSALFEIADMASSDMDMPVMLRELHAIVGRLMYAVNFYIALYDDELDVLRFAYMVDTEDPIVRDPAHPVPMQEMEHGLTWHVVRSGRPLMGNAEEIRLQVTGPMRDIGTECSDWLGVPMLSGNRVRGVLVVQSYIERPRYTQADQALLSFVGNHILTALDRKRAQEELEHRVRERTRELELEVDQRQRSQRLQETLYRLAELSNTAKSLDVFYAAVHHIVGEFMDTSNFYIALLSDDRETISFPYFVDQSSPPPPPRRPARGITEYVLRSGRPLLVSNEESWQLVAELEERGELETYGRESVAWLGVPLLCSNHAVGVIAVQSYTEGVDFTTADRELLTFISYQIANGLERQRAAAALKRANAELEQRVAERTQELSEQIAVREKIEQQLKHDALHDALTGLPNRTYLREQILRCLACLERDPQHRFAVLFLDLDRFKVINDSAGHIVGDHLLRVVAGRFSGCVRAGRDVVARLGGDEFAILMDGIRSHEDAIHMARRVIDALRAPVRIDDKDLFTSASVGIAVSSSNYRTPEDLLRDADIAMYRAKADDHNRIVVFDEQLHQEALGLLEVESDLRHAIARDEFEPYFQPIVRLGDTRVIGYEALMRWNHPTRGVLAPGAFLQVAEASGSLEEIDWLMFEHSFRAASRLLTPGQYINLNFSPRHFRNDDLDVRLLQRLEAHGVAPSQIRIEVTEGTLMQNPERVAKLFERLRAHGVLTALDDFGTGYSSLSYLHRFPLQTVKIDRSFVMDMKQGEGGGSTAIIRAILALSQSQSLEVVAEGVETLEQSAQLQQLGCELGQGYLFAKPRSLRDILAAA